MEESILVVSENGYGKRTLLDDYRVTNRGGKGVKTINITEKTGSLIAIKNVIDTDDLMIINRSGIIIRMGVSDLRVMGRATQGVRLINLKEEDAIAAVAKAELELEDENSDLSDSGEECLPDNELLESQEDNVVINE
jgi:DNA gyrase subunit A